MRTIGPVVGLPVPRDPTSPEATDPWVVGVLIEFDAAVVVYVAVEDPSAILPEPIETNRGLGPFTFAAERPGVVFLPHPGPRAPRATGYTFTTEDGSVVATAMARALFSTPETACRVAAVSCNGGDGSSSDPGEVLWSTLAGAEPDLIIHLGDQIYADGAVARAIDAVRAGTASASEALIALERDVRALYREAWSRPAVARVLASTPSMFLLDDHEITDDARPAEMPTDPFAADAHRLCVDLYAEYQEAINPRRAGAGGARGHAGKLLLVDLYTGAIYRSGGDDKEGVPEPSESLRFLALATLDSRSPRTETTFFGWEQKRALEDVLRRADVGGLIVGTQTSPFTVAPPCACCDASPAGLLGACCPANAAHDAWAARGVWLDDAEWLYARTLSWVEVAGRTLDGSALRAATVVAGDLHFAQSGRVGRASATEPFPSLTHVTASAISTPPPGGCAWCTLSCGRACPCTAVNGTHSARYAPDLERFENNYAIVTVTETGGQWRMGVDTIFPDSDPPRPTKPRGRTTSGSTAAEPLIVAPGSPYWSEG